MTSLWEMPVVVVLLLVWLATPPTSLADAARREAVRRQLTAKSATLVNNDNLPAARAGDTVPVSPDPVEAALDKEPETDPVVDKVAAEEPAGAAEPEAVAGESGDESSWRERFATLRTAVETDEVLAEGMQSRVNALRADAIARDDPAQQALLRQQLARAVAELERLKVRITGGRAAIAKLEQDARREGVPPGWTR